MKVTQFNTNTTFKKYSVRAMSDSVREGGGGEEGERRGRGGGEEAEYALRPGEGPARCKLKQEREKVKETSGVKWI